ncbi:MAG: hypothetical protein U0807_12075 [Candidatus Binatia bacterium]
MQGQRLVESFSKGSGSSRVRAVETGSELLETTPREIGIGQAALR